MATEEAVYDIVWADDHFVALLSGSNIASSTDGKVWNIHTYEIDDTLLRISWDGQCLLAVGQSRALYRSDDSILWQEAASLTKARAITCGGGLKVAAGGFGNLDVSRNTKVWESHSVGGLVLLFDVTYGANRFVAVGHPGAIIYSDLVNHVGPGK